MRGGAGEDEGGGQFAEVEEGENGEDVLKRQFQGAITNDRDLTDLKKNCAANWFDFLKMPRARRCANLDCAPRDAV